MTTANALHEKAFLRVWDIVGDRKRGISPLLPIGKTTFLNRVKTGQYPKPVRIAPRTVAWRVEDIRALLASFSEK